MLRAEVRRLRKDLDELLPHSKRAGEQSLVIPSEYLEVVIAKK